MDIDKIFRYIDENYEKHIFRLQELVRQPSVSGENLGIRECSELVYRYLNDIGCSSVRIVETSGNPIVYGEVNANADKTVLVYMMYDTQPFNEPGWFTPPLEGRIVDIQPFGRCLVARGAVNTKGPLVAFINAVESILNSNGELPVNLLFVIEGEEEIGSLHLPEFIDKYCDQLKKANVLFLPTASQDVKGKAIVYLGVKGIVYFELKCSGKLWGRGPQEFDIHGSHKAWVDSPTWRLIKALSTMVDDAGSRVLIDGFYNGIAPLTDEDTMLLEKLTQTFDEEAVKEELKIKEFTEALHGKLALLRYLFWPTLNIDGIWSGYIGPGTKTVLPCEATVKMDVRLVPNMRKEDIIPMIRKHLDSHGFQDIQITYREGYDWARVSIKEPAVQAMIKTYRDMGKEPEIWPTIAGSAPLSIFTSRLKIPFVMGGLGHGGHAHAPNEYIVVEDGVVGGLRTLEKSYILFLRNLAEEVRV